jgi:hypothetical protein
MPFCELYYVYVVRGAVQAHHGYLVIDDLNNFQRPKLSAEIYNKHSIVVKSIIIICSTVFRYSIPFQ